MRPEPAQLDQHVGPHVGGGRLRQRALEIAAAPRRRRRARPRSRRPHAAPRRRPLVPAAGRQQEVRGHLLGRGAAAPQLGRRALVGHLALARRTRRGRRRRRPAGARSRAGIRRAAPRRGRARRWRARPSLSSQLGQGRDGRQLGAVAEHRDRAGDRGAVRGQPAEPHQHHARHRARPDRVDGVGVRGVRPDALDLAGRAAAAAAAAGCRPWCGGTRRRSRRAPCSPSRCRTRLAGRRRRRAARGCTGTVAWSSASSASSASSSCALAGAQRRREQHRQALEPARAGRRGSATSRCRTTAGRRRPARSGCCSARLTVSQ